MTTVSVVYHSASGYTKLMAEAVLEGAVRDGRTEGHIFALERAQLAGGAGTIPPFSKRWTPPTPSCSVARRTWEMCRPR
jgi:hypothetical protein